ncbi:MAG: hypothetical protein ACI3Y2_05080, partial [Candidatus Egerieousia sp.]
FIRGLLFFLSNPLCGIKAYYYCGNVHVNKNKQGQTPQEGRRIKINDTKEEKEPYFTGDSYTLFYSKDWEFM